MNSAALSFAARDRFRPTVLPLILLLLSIPASARADDQTQIYEPQIYYVPNVIDQFNNINQRPDALAFGLGNSPTPSITRHYQGIVRKTGPGRPYLFVSRSGNAPPECPIVEQQLSCDSGPGNVVVVRMESRDTNGERLRSNRLMKDWPIAATNPLGQINPWPTPPDPRDAVVTTISFNGQNGWPNYGHAGGMQLLGNVLGVPLSHPYDAELPGNRILFIDVSNPEVPVKLSEFDPAPGPEFEAGQVAVTAVRNRNGVGLRYLLLVAGKDNRDVRLYRSRSTVPDDLDGPTDLKHMTPVSAEGDENSAWERIGSWTGDQLDDPVGGGDTWPTEGSQSHQMFNFVREGSLEGKVFLIATRNVESVYDLGDGTDLIYLYEIHVDRYGDLTKPDNDLLTFTAIKPVATNSIGGGGDTSHFTGSTGVYVSPSGELIIYASQHNAEGPRELTPSGDPGRRTVRIGEWRHIEMVRRNSPTLRPSVETSGPYEVDEGGSVGLSARGKAPITKAWIQLFEKTGAGLIDDVEDNPTWLVVDYDDWPRDDFDNFVKLLWYFNDEARSWRWFAHQGCSLRANEHTPDDSNFPGERTRTLRGSALDGTGAPAVAVNLADVWNDDRTASMYEVISGVEFPGEPLEDDCRRYYTAPIGVAWDLNGDGVFETSGEQVTFSAAQLDGPATHGVPVEAQHPMDSTNLGRGVALVNVVVRNVAPVIGSFALVDSRGLAVGSDVPFALVNVPYTAHATFTDPGRSDHQTATIAWGDGVSETSSQFESFSDAFGGALGRLAQPHTYVGAGDVTLQLTVTDDDAGVRSRSIGVSVLTPEQALEAIVDILDALIAAASSDAQRAALARARDKLVSNNLGDAANGALDMLVKGNTDATLVKLVQAIEELRQAEAAGADVGALIALLEQVIASVEAT